MEPLLERHFRGGAPMFVPFRLLQEHLREWIFRVFSCLEKMRTPSST
jgi:hypothetical protein